MWIKNIDNHLIDTEKGEILGSVVPRFQNYTYDKYVEEFNKNQIPRYLEPMTAQEWEHPRLKEHIKSSILVGEQKFDGHRGLLQFDGANKAIRLFSRRISKATNWFSENTDQVPHIRDIEFGELAGTIIDGEILLPVDNCDCRKVQGVTGALPETAIERQLNEGLAYVQVFDILYYKGVSVRAMPYWKRKLFLLKVIKTLNNPYLIMTQMYIEEKNYNNLIETMQKATHVYNEKIKNYISKVDDFFTCYKNFIGQNFEGMILKEVGAKYEHKKSPSFLKMKPHLMFDVVVMGYDEPDTYYDGKTLREGGKWEYWCDAEDESRIVHGELTAEKAEEEGLLAVTKFYAMNWIGAVRFGVWKAFSWDELKSMFKPSILEIGVENKMIIDEGEGKARVLIEVGKASGFNEADRAYITEHREELKLTTIEVEAQCIINKETGTLQHPRFNQFRPDKNPESCTFEEHIRQY